MTTPNFSTGFDRTLPASLPRLTITSTAMNTVDRMGWATGLAVTAYGRRIGVRVNEPKVLELISKYLPYGWKPAKSHLVEQMYSVYSSGGQNDARQRTPHLLFHGAERLACSLEMGEILETFGANLRLFIAEHARSYIFVHAAVVGWNGRAIVIPGKTMSGKTSLAAEFVRAGATYYSDEYALLDGRGRVHPFAKPLSIRSAADGYSQTDYPVEALGGTAGTEPLPVGVVLATQYRTGSRWRPRGVSRGVGVMSLLANTVSARKQPERVMDVLQKAVTSATIFKNVRGEASKVVRSVLLYENSAESYNVRPTNGVLDDTSKSHCT